MNWFYGAWAVFEKDARLEWRSRYAVNMLLMFVLSAILLIAFALGNDDVSPRTQAALLWVVILFAAAVGLGRAFISEEERGTVLLLQLNTRGSMVYTGKLLFNFLLLLSVNLVAVGTFILVLSIPIQSVGLLLTTLFLGALGLAGTTTLLAALIAQTAHKGPLLPVLLFPVLVPLLLSVVTATRHALEGGQGWAAVPNELMTLFGFAGAAITVSVLMFDYAWQE
jgi:heme exporter protein B